MQQQRFHVADRVRTLQPVGWLIRGSHGTIVRTFFGTDTYAGSDPQYGWDTVAWQTSHNARYALALALTGMMQDGEISRDRALELAHLVLHANAEKLYGIK